jgi:hypothetical protein
MKNEPKIITLDQEIKEHLEALREEVRETEKGKNDESQGSYRKIKQS